MRASGFVELMRVTFSVIVSVPRFFMGGRFFKTSEGSAMFATGCKAIGLEVADLMAGGN